MTTITVDDIPGAIGTEVGRSDWRTVTQEMINLFADATDDHQWIHLDPERAARETPFGGTIAHGFLTLSLLSTLAYEALPRLEDTAMGINYGFDKVRFMAPVRAGARVRAVFRLADADIRPSGRVLSTYDVTLEIENSLKPALTATWITMAVRERKD
ncbi:MAG: MaoC family dehydratase [Oricola sp.]